MLLVLEKRKRDGQSNTKDQLIVIIPKDLVKKITAKENVVAENINQINNQYRF
jgi:hypothetical protein